MLIPSLRRIRNAFDCQADGSDCRSAGAIGIEAFFETLSRLGRLHPMSRPEKHDVELIRDLPYRATGDPAHLLDVYLPRRSAPPRPIVLYVHGGGFRILSKDTHWVFGLSFARKGYLVFQINYRLAPQHRFPAPLEDVLAAYGWVLRNAAQYGGDVARIVVAGESAGANLVTSLALATVMTRPEPMAREAFELGVVPKAVWPACGILQVTDPERFWRHKPMKPIIKDRILAVCRGYVNHDGSPQGALLLANPLLALESSVETTRPLPPFYLSAGTRDPIVDDTRRLEAALRKRGVPVEARYDEGEPHAYQALLWKKSARGVWRDTFRFLDRHV